MWPESVDAKERRRSRTPPQQLQVEPQTSGPICPPGFLSRILANPGTSAAPPSSDSRSHFKGQVEREQSGPTQAAGALVFSYSGKFLGSFLVASYVDVLRNCSVGFQCTTQEKVKVRKPGFDVTKHPGEEKTALSKFVQFRT